MTNLQDILNLEAQAVLDTCQVEHCALCPDIAKNARRWFEIDDSEKIMMAMLLLNKVRKDLEESKRATQ